MAIILTSEWIPKWDHWVFVEGDAPAWGENPYNVTNPRSILGNWMRGVA